MVAEQAQFDLNGCDSAGNPAPEKEDEEDEEETDAADAARQYSEMRKRARDSRPVGGGTAMPSKANEGAMHAAARKKQRDNKRQRQGPESVESKPEECRRTWENVGERGRPGTFRKPEGDSVKWT